MSNTLKEIRRKLSCQSIVCQPGSQIDEPVDWRDKQNPYLKNSIISIPDHLFTLFSALSCLCFSLHLAAIFFAS